MLFADDLLILELEKLSFLLEVSHDLPETLLQEFDLRLEHFDLLVLLELPLCMLFNGLTLSLEILSSCLVINLNLSVLLLQVVKLFILNLGFVLETLVLGLDVTLNFRDVLLCLEESFLAEFLQELSVLSVDSLLLPLFVLSSLLDYLTMLTQEHLVSILFVFDLFLLDHTSVFEFKKHLLSLR